MLLTALIMAGGRGERFWPKSRRKTPKQTLPIFNGKPLIQSSIDRLLPLIPKEQIVVVTEKTVAAPIRTALADSFPTENIIVEPFGRNTAACIGLGTAYILNRYPDQDPIVAVVCADHMMPNAQRFREHLEVAVNLTQEQDYLVTFGLAPVYPETGFGYVESGDRIGSFNGIETYRAKRFVEKPDSITAQEYVRAGNYFWNSGMFVWRAQTILRQFQQYMPSLYSGLGQIQKSIGTGQEQKTVQAIYRKLDRVPIDIGIMEKAEKVAMVKSDFPWFDIGSWLTLERIRAQDSSGNVILGNFLGIDTKDSIIVSDRSLVATIGIENLVIVATKDAILVCPKNRTQEVKKIVAQLESSPQSRRFL